MPSYRKELETLTDYEIKFSDDGQQAMKNCDSETNKVSSIAVQAFCLEGFLNSSTEKGIPSRAWQSADLWDRNQSWERLMQLRFVRKSARGQRFPWVWLNTPNLCMHKMRLLTKIKQNRKNKKFLKEKKKGKKILKWDSIRIVKQQQMGRCDIMRHIFGLWLQFLTQSS